MSRASTRSVRPFVAAGLVLSFGLIGMVGVVSYRNTASLVAAADWKSHALEVVGDLEDLRAQLHRAEAGVRGFILTADRTFLEPYALTRQSLPRLVARLRELTRDDPRQQQRLASLESLIDARLDGLKVGIETRERRGPEAGSRFVLSDPGRRMMEEARALMREMVTEEKRVLSDRDAEMDASALACK